MRRKNCWPKGVDPSQVKKERRRQSTVPTFEEIAVKWWHHERDKWADSHADRVMKRLADNSFKALGRLPADQVNSPTGNRCY